MQLIGSPTSPYVRKARVNLAETGTMCDFVPVDAWQPDAARRPSFTGTLPPGFTPVA